MTLSRQDSRNCKKNVQQICSARHVTRSDLQSRKWQLTVKALLVTSLTRVRSAIASTGHLRLPFTRSADVALSIGITQIYWYNGVLNNESVRGFSFWPGTSLSRPIAGSLSTALKLSSSFNACVAMAAMASICDLCSC